MSFHLAQLNIALPRAPLEAPLMHEFVERLEPVKAAADASPGFVWRLQTEDGDATGIRAFGDDRLIVNMSVWESLEALRAFVYSNRGHLDAMRRRREWFERLGEMYLVLWWVPAGHVPDVGEAEERLELLRRIGPSAEAFTFRRWFPPPDGEHEATAVEDERELCPTG
jgi:heme-degrading monooxygenase HmoA